MPRDKRSKRGENYLAENTASLATGGVLFFFNWWLLDLPLTAMANAAFSY